MLTVQVDSSSHEFERLKDASAGCEAELGEPKDLFEKMKRGEDIGDVTEAGEMALCINVKMGHMSQKGEILPHEFKNHVNALTEDKEKRKEIMENCGPKNGKTPAEAALNFVKCMQKHLH